MKKIFSIFSVLALTLAAVSCSNDTDELANNEVGYLKIGIETNSATMTRADAPSDYDARTLVVEVKNKTTNEVVTPTIKKNDEGKYILDGEEYLVLAPGDYTVIAHSANWDGNGSGFNAPYYYGETTIKVKTKTLSTATITCTQANVKVTVTFSDNFKQSFAAATSTISSAITGVTDRVFNMNKELQPAYFPVGNLTVNLEVTNNSGDKYTKVDPITDVQPRDHYIINYTVADYGHQGGVTVQVDPTTHTYTYTFEVPRKGGTSLAAYSANAWSSFATVTGAITGKKADFDQTKLKVQYKTAAAAEWNDATDVTIDSEDKVSCKITGLTPETDYVYRLAYVSGSDEAISSEVSFTTEAQTALYNGGFEYWWYDSSVNDAAYPTESSDVKFWCTSNPASGSILAALSKLTDKTTEKKHGGNYSAKMTSAKTAGVLAAASLYTGSFKRLNTTSQVAYLNWGVPFTSRPTALKGYMIYEPGAVDVVSTGGKDGTPLPSDAPASGQPDHCQVYCALLDIETTLAINNGNLSTIPNWDTDPRVIAYGAFTQKTTQTAWSEFTINLEYHDLTKTPKYLVIVASSSKYGDYFHGSSTSVLYLDDFEFIYGDTPTVKQ